MLLRLLLLILLATTSSACGGRSIHFPLSAGHRGDREAGADNSARALQSGIQAGVPFLEIDLRYTKDGVVVLAHDSKLHHRHLPLPGVPEGTPIADLTLGELRGAPLIEESGFILTAEEAFGMLRGNLTSFLLDLKHRDPKLLATLVKLARGQGVFDRIYLQCYSAPILSFVKEQYPTLKTLARADANADVPVLLRLHPEIVQVDAEWVLPEVIAEIKKSGALVLIKAVDLGSDNEAGWARLRELGADIVLTDFPKKLLEKSLR